MSTFRSFCNLSLLLSLTAVVACDDVEYLDDNGAIQHLDDLDLADGDEDEQAAGEPACDSGAGAKVVVSVKNGTQLRDALKAAKPGHHIVLDKGNYTLPGGFELTNDGTAAAPIVVRSRERLAARLVSDFALHADHAVLCGVTFDDASVNIQGDSARLSRALFTDTTDIAVIVEAGLQPRVDHCEISGARARGVSVNPNPAKPLALQQPRIDNNYFHDSIGKPGTNAHEPLQVGQTLSDTNVQVGAIVERNLFERTDVDQECLSIKSSKNTVRLNTIRDSACYLNNRHGNGNFFIANWTIGSRGIGIRGKGNSVFNNKIVDSGNFGMLVEAGNTEPGSQTKGEPRAIDTLLAGNDFDRTTIGHVGQTDHKLKALDTRIEAHKGPIKLDRQDGTVQVPKTTVIAPVAVALFPKDVGPKAP